MSSRKRTKFMPLPPSPEVSDSEDGVNPYLAAEEKWGRKMWCRICRYPKCPLRRLLPPSEVDEEGHCRGCGRMVIQNDEQTLVHHYWLPEMHSGERASIEALARKIAGGHPCVPPAEPISEPPSAGEPLAEPSTSGTLATPQRKIVEWFPQVAADDHRHLVGLLLRVAPETEPVPAGEEVGADGQYRPRVRQGKGPAPSGWLPISESRDRVQVEEPEERLDESLSLASLAIPPLPEVINLDEEWGAPEPAKVYLNGPGNVDGRIEVVGTGFETQAVSHIQIPPEGMPEGLISCQGARFALNVARDPPPPPSQESKKKKKSKKAKKRKRMQEEER